MKLLDYLYYKNIESRKNHTLILISMLCIVLVGIFLIFFVNFKFHEILSTQGTLEPSAITEITLNFDGRVISNQMVPGRYYGRDEVLMILDKNFLIRELENARTKITAYQSDRVLLETKLRIPSQTVSLLEIREWESRLEGIQSSISEIENQIRNLEDMIRENTIRTPFECILLSSDYSGVQSGYIEKGKKICRLAAVENPVIRVDIDQSWYTRVKKGQKCIITDKVNRYEGIMEDLRIEEKDGSIRKYATVTAADMHQSDFGMKYQIKILTDELSILQMILRSFRAL